MLEIRDLSFSYGNRPVLKDVSLLADRGEVVSVLGRNGAGKSTLFRCILGLLPGYSGSVLLDGADARNLSVRELARRIAFIPQSTASVYHYSVSDVVLMGVTPSLGMLRSPGREELLRVDAALERLGILSFRQRCFHHLSEGEKQLVIFARALAQQAEVLLMDEPSSALDFANQFRILSEARSLAREGFTVIQAIHDPEKAYCFSDGVIALQDGAVFAQGRPADVLTEANIRQLYGLDVHLTSLFDDAVRIFTPSDTL